jgi:lipoprotein-releasing system permease protein
MFRPLFVFIGTRYTRAKRRNHFVSFISLTSMIGLALGVVVMIVVLSVMNGFDHEMRTRVLGMVPHATLETGEPISDWQSLPNKVKQNPQVVAVAPFTQMQGLLTNDGKVQKVLLNAIDPARERKVSIIDNFMQQGKLDELAPGEFGIVIGDKAAAKLGVGHRRQADLRRPGSQRDPGRHVPAHEALHRGRHLPCRRRRDRRLPGPHQPQRPGPPAPLEAGPGAGPAPEVRRPVPGAARAWSIAQQLGEELLRRDWTRTHGNLYQAIRMEKAMIGLLLLLIVAVAAFNIISTLVMVVNDKKATSPSCAPWAPRRADHAHLHGPGHGDRRGRYPDRRRGRDLAALNVSAAIAGIEGLIGHKFLNADVYFIDYLPSQVQAQDVLMVCGAALVLSFLATLYPAWRAARTQPAEALRYE